MRHRRRSHRRSHSMLGLGEPISLIAIPWLWVAGGALFAKLFLKKPLTDKDMEIAQTMRDLLNRADELDQVLDPSATEEQRAIYKTVYANNLAMAVGYDFGGEGMLVEAETDTNGNIIFVDETVNTTDAAGSPTTYTRKVPKVKSIVKRTGVVVGEECEVVTIKSTTKRGAFGLPVSDVEKKMVPCRNLTQAERILPQEEVIAIARLSRNRFDIKRRGAATLQGRV